MLCSKLPSFSYQIILRFTNVFRRFVDRDMMMRYLGLGIGHMNPASSPSEANAISAVPEPRYVPAQTEISNKSATTPPSNSVPMVVSDTVPMFPSDTNYQGTSNTDTAD